MGIIETTNELICGWLPMIKHRAVLFAAILIGLVWASVHFFLTNERSSAEAAAVANSANLAGAFEEHLSLSLLEIDRSLKIVRAAYIHGPDDFDLVNWLKSTQLFND